MDKRRGLAKVSVGYSAVGLVDIFIATASGIDTGLGLNFGSLARLLLVMLGSEFGQIFLILGILGGFLVLRKLGIVLFLGSGGLAFTSLPCPRRESLPPFTYKFGDLGKTQLLSFQGLSRLVRKDHVG